MKYPVSHERWLRDQAEAVTAATRDQRDAVQAKLDKLKATLLDVLDDENKCYDKGCVLIPTDIIRKILEEKA